MYVQSACGCSFTSNVAAKMGSAKLRVHHHNGIQHWPITRLIRAVGPEINFLQLVPLFREARHAGDTHGEPATAVVTPVTRPAWRMLLLWGSPIFSRGCSIHSHVAKLNPGARVACCVACLDLRMIGC